jgi:hypothetical protein
VVDELCLIQALLATGSNIDISVDYMVNSVLTCFELFISKVCGLLEP